MIYFIKQNTHIYAQNNTVFVMLSIGNLLNVGNLLIFGNELFFFFLRTLGKALGICTILPFSSSGAKLPLLITGNAHKLCKVM